MLTCADSTLSCNSTKNLLSAGSNCPCNKICYQINNKVKGCIPFETLGEDNANLQARESNVSGHRLMRRQQGGTLLGNQTCHVLGTAKFSIAPFDTFDTKALTSAI